jgi:DhnA family fructose-bisphosphate aldolase class Ia
MVKNRMRRLFGPDGRTVIVAIDHAAYYGPQPGLEEPEKILNSAIRAGVDAVLATYGIAARFGGVMGRLGLILRADGGSTRLGSGGIRRMFTAEDALRVGADAMVCMGLIGGPDESASLDVLTSLVRECGPWGLPVMAEMLLQKPQGQPLTPQDIAFAARVGVELGADLIKTNYVGTEAEFRRVTAECYAPIVMLGGEKTPDPQSMLQSVAEALRAGVAGVAIGRNIWQHANPEGMARALVAVVHGGATVPQAMKELGE